MKKGCAFLCLFPAIKCICRSHSVGQFKQPVAAGSLTEKNKNKKSEHHLSKNNSNMLKLAASAEVQVCKSSRELCLTSEIY